MKRLLCLAAAVGGVLFCSGLPSARAEGFLTNGLLPAVPVPAGNAQDSAKIKLGTMLYFDMRLSKDNTVSCATCHRPDAGWADPDRFSSGVGGAKGGRQAPTVLNSAFHALQFWDGRAADLEAQALGPIANPVEMDLPLPDALARLKALPGYVAQFKAVFGSEPTASGLAQAIAAFERTIISTNSPFDKYLQGDEKAMTAEAKRGMDLFNGKAHCSPCHSGPNFSDSRFHNLGVGFKNGKLADVGRSAISGDPRDLGAFKTPGLRSIAETAPYMHDGSERTLEAVVDFYDRGGNPNPTLDRAMLPLHLTRREKRELVAFLKALTGEKVTVAVPQLP